MAIGTAVNIYDGVSKPVQAMVKSLTAGANAFKTLKAQTNTAFNATPYTTANNGLNKIKAAVSGVTSGIKQTISAQKQLNSSMKDGSSAAGDLQKKVGQMVAAYVSIKTVLKGMSTSDSLVRNNLRISQINNGMQTDAALRNSIYDAANGAGADFTGFAKYVTNIGEAGGRNFSGPDDVIKFVGLMQKQMVSSGAEMEEISSVMDSMEMALSTGALDGRGAKNLIMNAPELAKEIARVSGTTIDGLQKLAGEGAITASVLKTALFSIEDTINEQYANTPKTFGNMWSIIKNQSIRGFEDASKHLSNLVNTDSLQKTAVIIGDTIGDITKVIGMAVGRVTGYIDSFSKNQNAVKMFSELRTAALVSFEVLFRGLDILVAVIGVVADNWLWFRYIVYGAVGAFIAVKVAALAAALGVNAALWPVTVTVAAVVASIYILVWAWNKLTGDSVSAAGATAAVFTAFFALIHNYVTYTYNIVSAFAEFLRNVFRNPVYSIQRLIANLQMSFIDFTISSSAIWGTFVNGYVNAFVAGINLIKSKWNELASSAIGEMLNLKPVEMTANVDVAGGMVGQLENLKSDINGYMEAQMPDDYVVYNKMEYKDIGKAAQSGYDWGAGAESSVSNIIGGKSLALPDDDTTTTSTVAYGTGSGSGLSDSPGTIAELRDYARRESISSTNNNRVVNIELNNEIIIENGMGKEEVISMFTDAMEEALNADAEGV